MDFFCLFGERVTFPLPPFFSLLEEPLLCNLCFSCKRRAPCLRPLASGSRHLHPAPEGGGTAGPDSGGSGAGRSLGRRQFIGCRDKRAASDWSTGLSVTTNRAPGRALDSPPVPPCLRRPRPPPLLRERSGSAPLRAVRGTRPVPVGRSTRGRPRAGKSSPIAAGRGGAARAGGAEGGAAAGAGPLPAGAGALPGRGAGERGGAGAGHSQRQPWAGRHKGSVTRLPERRRSPGNRPLPLYPGASPGWERGGAGVPAGVRSPCPGARSPLRSYAGCGRRARSSVGPGGRPLRAVGRVPASAPRPRRRCPGAP